jgi:putative alpha-1,2-mannosidase
MSTEIHNSRDKRKIKKDIPGGGILAILALIIIAVAGFFLKYNNRSSERDLVDLVNPLMGTDSEYKLSNGNTYPAVALPWGMNFWTPQTRSMGNGWAYTYNDYKIMGIKQTHQPSPWINDYAAFSLMPLTGKIKTGENERASWFSHKAEVAKPYYYSVYLADYDVTAEVTPTERAAIFRFTFPIAILHIFLSMPLTKVRW